MQHFFELGNIPTAEAIQREVSAKLSDKLEKSRVITHQEIDSVANFPFRIFPPGFALSTKAAEKLRIIARTAFVEIGPSQEIKSHRKLIGPIIVWLKKATRPFIEVHLRQLFERQSLFNAQLVALVAEQEVRLASLEKANSKGAE